MSGPATNTGGEPSPTRRFNLGDAMIVVGVFAVAMWLSGKWKFDGWWNRAQFCRLIIGQLAGWWHEYNWSKRELSVILLRTATDQLREDLWIMLMCLTPVVILFRLKQPRPSSIELLQQPGFVAPCAALVACVLVRNLDYFRPLSSVTIGVAVGVIWTPLLVGRYWKA